MEYIYIRREGDSESLKNNVLKLNEVTNENLIASYNKEVECGITGVHSQAIYLMAMGHTFFKRFGKSPIHMENNILGLGKKVRLSGSTYECSE